MRIFTNITKGDLITERSFGSLHEIHYKFSFINVRLNEATFKSSIYAFSDQQR